MLIFFLSGCATKESSSKIGAGASQQDASQLTGLWRAEKAFTLNFQTQKLEERKTSALDFAEFKDGQVCRAGSGSFYLEKVFKKGTCKLQDFTVINGYNSIENRYIRLYSWGKTANDLSSAFSAFYSVGQADYRRQDNSQPTEPMTTLIGTPFNSVWAYSNSECQLAVEIPNQFKNFLLVLATAGADQTQTISAPYQKGQQPPPPQTRTVQGIRFAPGWNFFVGSQDMEGKNFDEMRGSCDIEKAYTFDASSQSWKQLTSGPGPTTNFAFKVTNKCMFGMPEIPIPETPQ